MESLDDYILRHTDEENPRLAALYRSAWLHLMNPRMSSGHVQGRVLKMLVAMARPRHILEIGTFAGYSALCMAEALTGEGRLTTFEIDDELEDFTRPQIEGSPWAVRIDFRIGDALVEVPRLGETYDFVFIDGDKRHYVEYYEMVMQHTTSDAFILADNTLWDGHVTDPAYDRDAQTIAIRDFNDRLVADRRVEKVILPVRDGLTLIHKIPNLQNAKPE